MHAEAETAAAGVVVYLLPGLTPDQRKAALRRLRQEGSRGCGPHLPAAQLTAALAADRLRTGVQSTTGAVRHHPVRTLVPAVLAGGLLAAFVFASMYARVDSASPGPAPGGAASWTVPVSPADQGSSSRVPGRPPAPRVAPRQDPARGSSRGAATTRALPTRP
jgi:hypothetical protein